MKTFFMKFFMNILNSYGVCVNCLIVFTKFYWKLYYISSLLSTPSTTIILVSLSLYL